MLLFKNPYEFWITLKDNKVIHVIFKYSFFVKNEKKEHIMRRRFLFGYLYKSCSSFFIIEFHLFFFGHFRLSTNCLWVTINVLYKPAFPLFDQLRNDLQKQTPISSTHCCSVRKVSLKTLFSFLITRILSNSQPSLPSHFTKSVNVSHCVEFM